MKLLGLLFAVVVAFGLWTQPVNAVDLRAHRLAKFLASQKSPLAFLADDFVHQADRQGLDYRLLPAIAGVESTFGKNYIPGTYNVYGWGKGTIPFDSWVDGMAKVSLGLQKNYVGKGALSVAAIAPIYDPPGAKRWAAGVNYFMAKIEQTPVFLETVDGLVLDL